MFGMPLVLIGGFEVKFDRVKVTSRP